MNSEGLRYEKELINCGLKKLANSINTTVNTYPQHNAARNRKKGKLRERSATNPRLRKVAVVPHEKSQLKSHSDYSLAARDQEDDIKVCCTNHQSTPAIQTKRNGQIETKPEHFVSKYTMTKPNDLNEGLTFISKKKRSVPPLEHPSDNEESVKAQEIMGFEKLKVLKKEPYRRSWTLPEWKMQSRYDRVEETTDKNSDRQTYLYDDGTEIDSEYIQEKQQQFNNRTPHKQCIVILFFCGSVCGILLVSLLIWFMFGNNLLSLFLKPRKVSQGGVSKSFKYLGGGLIYILTRIFENVGYLLALPTQKVYQSEPEYYRWPINPVQ